MSRLPAAMRHLDPWAALLLGVLIALGVIILLATPGPWHRVVPTRPHVQVAPSPPGDVAVFVHAGEIDSRCTGIVWVHLRYEAPAVSVVVVPPQTFSRLPGAGYESLAQIVADAGPEAGAQALGEVTGVQMDAWVSLGGQAVHDAFPEFVRASASRRGRSTLKAIVASWSGRGARTDVARLQVAFLRRAIAQWHRRDLNLVAFVNYLLGAPAAVTDMKLQQASALAAALAQTPRQRLLVSGLPSVAWQRGDYRRWLPQGDGLVALRRAFAVEALPPVLSPSLEARPAGGRVLVLTGLDARAAAAYGAALGRALKASSGHDLEIDLAACRTVADVGAALRERPDGRPPLAVVVALGRSRSGPLAPGSAAALVTEAAAGVRARIQPALVSQVPGPGEAAAAVNEEIARVADESGLPLSVVAAPPGPPAESDAPRLTTAQVAGWARANAAALVRCVEPSFFAPRLASTRLGVSYYERRALDVGVVEPDPARAALVLARLENLGYDAVQVEWEPAETFPRPAVAYLDEDRRLALCLAGDSGVPARRVRGDEEAPKPLTLLPAP